MRLTSLFLLSLCLHAAQSLRHGSSCFANSLKVAPRHLWHARTSPISGFSGGFASQSLGRGRAAQVQRGERGACGLRAMADTPKTKEGFEDALTEMGKIATKFQAFTKATDPAEAAELRKDLIESYTRFAVPAASFSATSLSLFIATFTVLYTVLSVSGLGYEAVLDLTEDVPLLGGALAAVPDGWGNIGITFIALELFAPFLAAAAVAITPKVAKWLEEQLPGWGLDAEGLNKRMESLKPKA